MVIIFSYLKIVISYIIRTLSPVHNVFSCSNVVNNTFLCSNIEAKETYYRGKRDLLQRQKRPTIEAKETYYFSHVVM